MTPDEVVEIFNTATTVYPKVNLKLTFSDISVFYEKDVIVMVEIIRDFDVDEHGML